MIPQNIPDKEIIVKYLDGEDDALNLLIQRYIKSIYNFVYRYAKNSRDAEDITQDVFILVWKHIKKFDGQKSFRAWIFTIARNTSLNWIKKKKPVLFSELQTVSLQDDDPSEELFNIADESIISIEESIDALIRNRHVKDAMETLSPQYQNIISMRIDGGFTFQEIADVLDQSINTIQSNYRRALLKLKTFLEPLIDKGI
jgi:RNA polymerase sigma-70 factor (ECF subfamily)